MHWNCVPHLQSQILRATHVGRDYGWFTLSQLRGRSRMKITWCAFSFVLGLLLNVRASDTKPVCDTDYWSCVQFQGGVYLGQRSSLPTSELRCDPDLDCISLRLCCCYFPPRQSEACQRSLLEASAVHRFSLLVCDSDAPVHCDLNANDNYCFNLWRNWDYLHTCRLVDDSHLQLGRLANGWQSSKDPVICCEIRNWLAFNLYRGPL